MHQLPPLPYAYDALEPFIDEATMKLHHDKHHQTYIDKLNAGLEKYPDLAAEPVADLVARLDKLPAEVKTVVRHHGGGHLNHAFFWEILTPAAQSGAPDQVLLKALAQTFDDDAKFRERFKTAALGVFGSGWAWLAKNARGELAITATANQDSPASQGLKPILGVDVWEHAYYLKYQNRRAEYLEAFFRVINWGKVGELYRAA